MAAILAQRAHIWTAIEAVGNLTETPGRFAAVPTLAELMEALDSWYPSATAESWDSVGLTCGDPRAEIGRVLLAVDCVPSTVAETLDSKAQLLVTHHPLLLTGVHSVTATDPKTSMIHRMIRAGVAHFAAHTNADIAVAGVSEALAQRLGVTDLRPLQPAAADALDHLSVLVPGEHLDGLVAALAEAGAGTIGKYDRCTFTIEGTGTFRPVEGAHPFDGEVGVLSSRPETRLSMALPRGRRETVIAAMRVAHPYEDVAFELTEEPRLNAATGTGRIGSLPTAMSLREFTAFAADRLPKTVWGIRAAGDPDQLIQTAAVCGGAGGSYAELARRAGADVYLTADLRHHSTSEAVAEWAPVSSGPSMALIDAAHWATEAPWLDSAAELLRRRFGSGLEVAVSQIVTDPWTLHHH
jgi:dinuclear metal center YbgI/SA1388 family protein